MAEGSSQVIIYQVPVTFRWGCSLSPSYARMLTGLVLYKSCVGNHSCCEFMSAVTMLQHFSSIFQLLHSFYPFPEPGGGVDIDLPFRAEHSNSHFILSTLSRPESLTLTAKRSFFDQG